MEAETQTKLIDRQPDSEASFTRPAAPLSVGKFVGEYELILRLGRGGMAEVFLGRATGRKGFEKLVAVKVINPVLLDEPEFIEMFLDEARIAARLQHPHIVEIHKLGETEHENLPYMVMEYVEGETLATTLRSLKKSDTTMPLAAVLQVVADACGGLACAHELTHRDGQPMHLVHRDVSPHNLLVAKDGRVKVVDFGIAKATGRRSSTRTGQLRGKIAYMSPEQASGGTIDHRTDLFALGSVLWELLTNRRLFVGETDTETLAQVNVCNVPDLTKLRPDLSPAVVEFVQHALARDPDERFDSARQMLREARALLRQISGEQEPREVLAGVMVDLFADSIRYREGIIRKASESGPRPRLVVSGPDAEDATRQVEHPDAASDRGAQGSGSNPIRNTGSLPIAAANTTGVQTLTTSIATAPARHWSLWLVLPLVGAVAGVALFNSSLFGGNDDAKPQTAVQAPSQRPTLAASESGPRPTRARPLPTTVHLTVEVEPEGASIELDGRLQSQTAPATLNVDRGDAPIKVRITKDGYEPYEFEFVPVESSRTNLQLRPVEAVAEAPEASPEPSPAPRKTGTWLRARTKKKKPPADASPQPTTPPKDDGSGADDERRPAPMPDWEKAFQDKTP